MAKPSNTKKGSIKTKSKSATGVSVLDIIFDRVMQNIEDNKQMPWDKGFIPSSINWYTEKWYKGINLFLLADGEYLTMKQLQTFNEEQKAKLEKKYKKEGKDINSDEFKEKLKEITYFVKKGTKSEIVVFYSMTKKPLTDVEIETYKVKEFEVKGKTEGYINTTHIMKVKIKEDEEAVWCKINWVLRYYNVFNIEDCVNGKGKSLPSKREKSIWVSNKQADDVVKEYVARTGVGISNDISGVGSAYYTHIEDKVHIPKPERFKSPELYYRVLFHELGHSTGIESRLKRKCFEDYAKDKAERSKEEVIAETVSILLSSDCKLKVNDGDVERSDAYLQSWLKWAKDNKKDFIEGLMQGAKAKEYILGASAKELQDPTETAVSEEK